MFKKIVKSKIFYFIVALPVSLFLLNTSTIAQRYSYQPQTGESEMSPATKSALRSLLFPGLGQLNNGQETKGYIFMGLGAVLLGTTIYMGISQNSLWKDYEVALTKSAYDAYVSRVHTANWCIGITAAFWAFNVLDAYLGAEKKAGGGRGYYGYSTSPYSTGGYGTYGPSSVQAVKRCPNCGAEVAPDAKFCPVCGAAIPSGPAMSSPYSTGGYGTSQPSTSQPSSRPSRPAVKKDQKK